MNTFNNRTVGWITIAAGISALIGTLAMIEFMVIGNSGLFSDYISIFTAVLMLPLMIALGKIAMTKQENLGRGVLILGVLGALINFVGGIINVIALEGIIEYYHSADWIYVGGGLVGIAILTFALLNRTNPEMKASYVWFSILFGLGACTFLLGLIVRDELNALMRFEITFAEASPFLMGMLFFGAPVFILGQPIWLLWTGRLFLKEKLSIEG